jgi:hypothetical protein
MHLKAYENIVEKYDFWRKALKTSWKEYLSEIEQNSLTGEWAKEVANYLINNEGTRSVEESKETSLIDVIFTESVVP